MPPQHRRSQPRNRAPSDQGSNGLASLRQPDGSVVIPPHLAGPVLRLLVLALAEQVRRDGGETSAAVRAILWGLHDAATQHDARTGFDDETPARTAATIEMDTADAAQVLGCSRQYVRRLAASGRLTARRAGRTWLVDPHSLTRRTA